MNEYPLSTFVAECARCGSDLAAAICLNCKRAAELRRLASVRQLASHHAALNIERDVMLSVHSWAVSEAERLQLEAV